MAGAVTSTAQGIVETGGGLALATGGGTAGALTCVPTIGAGCVAGSGVAVEGAIVSAHGAMVALQGVKDTIEITALLARRQGQGSQNVSSENSGYYKQGPQYKTKDLLAQGGERISSERRNINSPSFIDFVRQQYGYYKQSDWEKIMEVWQFPDGTTLKRNYWRNSAGDIWYHE